MVPFQVNEIKYFLLLREGPDASSLVVVDFGLAHVFTFIYALYISTLYIIIWRTCEFSAGYQDQEEKQWQHKP